MMGCRDRYYEYANRYIAPCANCGKERKGIMSSTEWLHNYQCCSNRCGMRLRKRIENGMYKPNNKLDNLSTPFSFFPSHNYDERIESLRFRIKHLESQLKQHGIKPKGTSF